MIDEPRDIGFAAEEATELVILEDKRAHRAVGNRRRRRGSIGQESNFANEVATLRLRDLTISDIHSDAARADEEDSDERARSSGRSSLETCRLSAKLAAIDWEVGMSIWERLSVAARDFSAKGQISSLLGFRGAHETQRAPDPQEGNEVPFTVGVIVLSAKMAKADGVVAADEVQAFKEAFKVSPAEMKHAAPVFNTAKRDAADFEVHAEQLVSTFRSNRKLLEDVLDGLFHIAKADQEVHRQEEEFLAGVAKCFGLTASEFNSIKARHMVASKRNPYDMLGVTPSISDEELESHYRRALEDNQTDQLTARGVPKEFLIIAIEKQAALTEAYDAILRERSTA